MPVIERTTVQLGNNTFADIEVYPKTDVPQFYPGHTTCLGTSTLFLCDLHDESYKPAPEQKDSLMSQIQSKKSWAYFRILQGREREG